MEIKTLEIEKIIKSLVQEAFKRHKDMKFSFPEFNFLDYIKRKQGATASDISKEFNITIGGVMHVLDSLQENEYITKIVLDDKRKKTYKITNKGLDELNAIYQEKINHEESLIKYLGEEDTNTLIRILKRIKDYVEVENEDKR